MKLPAVILWGTVSGMVGSLIVVGVNESSRSNCLLSVAYERPRDPKADALERAKRQMIEEFKRQAPKPKLWWMPQPRVTQQV